MMRQKFCLWSLIFLMICGCAAQTKSQKSPSALSISDAQEIAIGEQIHAEILSSFYPYTEPKLVHYVNRIGNSLAVHSERRHLPYRFTVLYNDRIYAASAPGGFIYLTTGMIYFLRNEAELAAVIAHEIGELQYRDPMQSRSRALLDSITKGGAMIAPAFGSLGALAAIGMVVLNNANHPEAVTAEQKLIESDERALHYMVEAGYDPQGMVDLIYKFAEAKSEIQPYFLDYYKSRPLNEARVKALDRVFAALSLQGKSLETRPEVYQEMTKGLREMYTQP